MAFGLLGSIIPQINRNEVFYTSLPLEVAVGKVSISSKNHNPVKIRLGITEDDINIEYLVYNRYVNYGETFETELIHLGNGQKLIARSSDPDVNFLFYGESLSDSFGSGMLSSVLSTDAQKKLLYSTPVDSNAIVTLSVCNLDSQPAKARIGISDGEISAFDSSEYLEYDVEIGSNQTYTRTEIKINEGQTLVCSSSEDSNVNFVCHGIITFSSGDAGDFFASGNAIINGNVGIGTFPAREKLDVIGNALVSNNLNVGDKLTSKSLSVSSGMVVGGITTANISAQSLNQSLINLQSLPAIDGSLLTGVIATGSGVVVSDDNILKGVASTLNFGDNIAVNVASGLGTVSLNDSVNVRQQLTVATNKFIVNGITGNTEIKGVLSVSSNIDALNNKVINVGSATSFTDATNKKYVDTRSIAMSIALS